MKNTLLPSYDNRLGRSHKAFMALFFWLGFLFLYSVLWFSTAHALESKVVTSPHSTASLITDSDTYDSHKPPHIALRLRLKPEWHTYWINPGDAGDPVRVDLTATGAATGESQELDWPAPEQIKEGSLISNAYTGDVVLPVKITLQENHEKDIRNDTHNLRLKAIGSWLVCKDSCIPEYGEFALTLPKGNYKTSPQKIFFENAQQNIPKIAPWSVSLVPPATLVINDPTLTEHSITSAHFTPLERGTIVESVPQFPVIEPPKFELHLTPSIDFSAHHPLDGLLTLNFASGDVENYSVSAHPGATPPSHEENIQTTDAPAEKEHFLDLIVFAFVGGLILNLMPCVFPILAMKVMGFTRMAHQEQRKNQQNALAYAGGTIIAFVLLGTLIMFLRYFGVMAGWGVQFQSPIFVGLIYWFLFLIALELLGVFSFQLPQFQTQYHLRNDLISSTITGVLAVIVASPCTAPFMGIAVAGALNTTPFAGLFVFATLGLGLATPFVILTYYPFLLSYLPKPGPWMVYLRHSLAFPILLSCSWLLWVATRESGSSAAFYLTLGTTILGLLAWLYGDYQKRFIEGRKTKISSISLGVLSFVGVLVLFLCLSFLPNPGDVAAEKEFSIDVPGSVSFSRDKLKLLHEQKKPVFVDMTAAWCLTCIANERMVLDTNPVRYAFRSNHVVFMQGDWTHRDETITSFLHQYGHDGVPFYLFLPVKGEPIILPQILTQDIIINTLNKAQDNTSHTPYK